MKAFAGAVAGVIPLLALTFGAILVSPIMPAKAAQPECGIASFYGREHHGKQTASGERFDMNAMTAAHPRLPFGTILWLQSGNKVARVTVTDRGPFIPGRIIDVSFAAAKKLGMIEKGVAVVCLTVEGQRV